MQHSVGSHLQVWGVSGKLGQATIQILSKEGEPKIPYFKYSKECDKAFYCTGIITDRDSVGIAIRKRTFVAGLTSSTAKDDNMACVDVLRDWM